MTAPLAERIKLEGGDRIMIVMRDYETQMNILAYNVGLLMKERSGVPLTSVEESHIMLSLAIQQWIRDMQTKAAQLVASSDETFEDESHWPAPPPGADLFIAQF